MSLFMIEIGTLVICALAAHSVRSAVGIQPIEESADLCGRQCDVVIGSAIVQPQRIAIRLQNMATGKDNIADIADTLVIFLGTKDPFVAADEASLWCFQIEEGETKPI